MKTDILKRYADLPLPRYTSYPTAPHFKPAGGDLYRDWLSEVPLNEPTSVYLHVPFCRSMCWYCGCHTTITARDEPIARYLAALQAEIDLVGRTLKGRLQARHIHFGGGTPTLMQPQQFADLMDQLRRVFDVADEAEVAIEIDPRTLDTDMVAALAAGGVTRASLGVQSFDPVVQKAINRIQSFEQTSAAVLELRRLGVVKVNFDLIYGLPHQTIKSCQDTVAKAVKMAPDRFAVFGYAHVPDFKMHQRKIEAAALPDGEARHAQAEAIAEALVDAGYVRIGLDHFAKPEDPLALAHSQGKLHRNFQGYTTDDCPTLIGLGASSIGRLPQGYVQNAVLIGDYERRIGAGTFAVSKGCTFAAEDRLRAAVIERLMCDYRVDLRAVCAPFDANPEDLIGDDERLQVLINDGLAERDSFVIAMREEARPLVRVLAAAFDQYLGQGPARHSRAV